jgi:hypothetical protein
MADGAQGDRLGLALSDALRDAAVPEIRSELTRRLGPEVATIDRFVASPPRRAAPRRRLRASHSLTRVARALSLVDYILLLIKNNHEKGDVATDLVEFFEGDQQGTQGQSPHPLPSPPPPPPPPPRAHRTRRVY